MDACPIHPTFDPSCPICVAWSDISLEKKKLGLQQEKFQLDRKLFKEERRKFKRDAQVAAYATPHHQPADAQSTGSSERRMEREIKVWRDKLQKEQQDHVRETGEYKQMISGLNDRVEMANHQQSRLEEETRRLKTLLKQQEDDMEDALDKERDGHKMAMIEVKLDMSRKNLEIERLQRSLEELEAQGNLEELQGKLEDMEAEKLALRSKLDDHVTRMGEMQRNQEDEIQQHTEAYEAKITELEQSQASELRKMKELVSSLEASSEELNTALREKDNEHQTEKEELEEKVIAQAREVQELKESLDVVEDELELSKDAITALESDKKKMERRVAELKETTMTLESARASMDDNHDRMEEDLLEAREEWERQKEEYERTIRELEEKYGQQKVGPASVNPTETERLRGELKELENREVELLNEKELISDELQDLKALNDRLSSELEELRDANELMRLQQQLENMQDRQDEFLNSQKSQVREIEALIGNVSNRQEQLFGRELPVLEKQVLEIESQLSSLEKMERPLPEIPPDTMGNGGVGMATKSPPGRQVTELDFKGEKQSGKYTGMVNDDGIPNGRGTLRVDNGDVYEGEWMSGMRHGQGVYTWYEGDLYSGAWKNGRRHGHGVFVYSDGRLYDGEYRMGSREGHGVFTWPYGAKFKGVYKGDKRNGKGEYVYADGRKYKGEYKEDRPHGLGVETSKEGKVTAEGEWKYGEFIGDAASTVGSFLT